MNTEIISEVCGYEKKKGDFHKEATVHLKKETDPPLYYSQKTFLDILLKATTINQKLFLIISNFKSSLNTILILKFTYMTVKVLKVLK